MCNMSLTTRIYIGVVLALGTIALAHGLYLWVPHDLLRFACYLALAIPASCLKVTLPKITGTMSVLFVFLLAGAVELGLAETLVIGSICVIVQSFWHARSRVRAIHVLFSIATLALTITATYYAYSAIPIRSKAFRLVIGASVYFAVNTFPIAMVISLTEKKSLRKVWSGCYLWCFPYYLVGAAIVSAFTYGNRMIDWRAGILILPVVYVVYRSYLLYLNKLQIERQRTEDERHRADEQRIHAEEIAILHGQAMEALSSSKQNEEALRRANDDLRQFAYAAAHDLQEPLRNIANALGLISRVQKQPLETEVTVLVEESIDSAQRLMQMVKDLLAFSKVVGESGRTSEPIDTNAVMHQVLKDLAAAISESGALLTATRLPLVEIENAHLLQLFQNLIGNALKYRRAGVRPLIKISAVRQGDEWLFTVADNGIGFDPIYAERIFGVFKRLHLRGQYPGTGIGLALCSRIVALYGGRIWAESQVGVGSNFKFTVPASKVRERSEQLSCTLQES
jgi:signal transduction histidine kinase